MVRAKERVLSDLAVEQVSLSEWFAKMEYRDSRKFRSEDKTKDARLKVLQTVIGLPITPVIEFEANEVAAKKGMFAQYYIQHANELCGFKLIPKQADLPKHRIRGLTLREAVNNWMIERAVDGNNYTVQVLPHAKQTNWSAIVVVNKQGIFGEVLSGTLFELSTGLFKEAFPSVFFGDGLEWQTDPESKEVLAWAKQVMEYIKVEDKKKREVLDKKVKAKFWQDYLMGYFEIVDDDIGLHWHDYNRLLGKLLTNKVNKSVPGDVTGRTGSVGRSRGRVSVVIDPQGVKIKDGDILVCDMTSPVYLPLMKRAGAIITDRGGMLCHAAIVARELNKPCVVGTKNATQILKDGDMVEVDADKGVVKKL